jgi:hypothetical protein
MRYVVIAAVVVAGAVLAPVSASAQKKSCPKDALPASVAIWPVGSISTGKLVRGRHPCGRSMECTGGTSATTRGGGGRSCRWL